MPADMLTYGRITNRLSFSSAFEALVNRFRLPRQRRNDGNGLPSIELTEGPTVTADALGVDRSMVATLTARIETLEADFAKVEAAAAMHRADFERERERCERLMAEVLKGTAELMAAREAAARIASELAALQARPWWRRLAG
jgi:chorismate mutase